jgi:hypothetical protein
MLEPAAIRVEDVTWNQPRADPAGDRLQLALADQRANVVLGAPELVADLADRQRLGPLHPWSMAAANGRWCQISMPRPEELARACADAMAAADLASRDAGIELRDVGSGRATTAMRVAATTRATPTGT